MVTSMYIFGFLSSATSNSTYHRYAPDAKQVRLRKLVLVLLCRFCDANNSNDDVRSNLLLVHLDSRKLFMQDAFKTIVCLKAADRNSNNTHLRGNFPTKSLYRECVDLLADLGKLRTVLNARFPEKYTLHDSFLYVPILKKEVRSEGVVLPSGTCS